MFETVFVISAAGCTIVIAGLLVRRQARNEEKTKNLQEAAKDSLASITTDVAVLTSKDIPEATIDYVEKRLKTFRNTLDMINYPNRKRRGKFVKRQKDVTDD